MASAKIVNCKASDKLDICEDIQESVQASARVNWTTRRLEYVVFENDQESVQVSAKDASLSAGQLAELELEAWANCESLDLRLSQNEPETLAEMFLRRGGTDKESQKVCRKEWLERDRPPSYKRQRREVDPHWLAQKLSTICWSSRCSSVQVSDA